ncbi:MAG: exodeoxyribonuclease VII small subunit [Erysipelotrichaceae bacterium]|nr:exodeoxyribonuclease VII small subunit [Erysipelotrichaceae bacterium]
MAQEIKFEEQMKKLQEIVEKLERNDIELDESISLYEEGLKLSKTLKDQLLQFEEKIAQLNKDSDEDE